jgi:hypothetical protein
MTRSARFCLLALALVLSAGQVLAATPPDAEMAAAASAVANAERAEPRGAAAQALETAKLRFAEARASIVRKKYRDALRQAEEARANADLALARAHLAQAQIGLDEKAARNADLRRQLLVQPESRP